MQHVTKAQYERLFKRQLATLCDEAEERANAARNQGDELAKDRYTAVAGLLDAAVRRFASE